MKITGAKGQSFMTSSSAPSSVPGPSASSETTEMIEAILRHRFPLKVFSDAAERFWQQQAMLKGQAHHPEKTELQLEVEEARVKLHAMPAAQLLATYKQVNAQRAVRESERVAEARSQALAKAAAKEAAMFYNQPNAQADWAFWTKLGHWTFDEAVSLLMEKDPRVVTWASIKRELEPRPGVLFSSKPAEPSEFVLQYQRLRTVAGRADALIARQLKPIHVIHWAQTTQVCEVPEALQRLAESLQATPTTGKATPSHANSAECAGPELGNPRTDSTKESEKKWTSEKLKELASYRDKHGTKATAATYGISAARVRQLLPKETPTSKQGTWSAGLGKRPSRY